MSIPTSKAALRTAVAAAAVALGLYGSAGAVEVMYWPLNEGSGSVAQDATANDYDGTLTNGPAYVPGISGTALSFDGTDDYVLGEIITASVNNTDTVSLSVWFKAVPGTGGVIVDELGGSGINAGWHDSQIELLPSGEVRGRVWDNGGISLGVVPAAELGDWHHVVLRYNTDTDVLDGFLDGVESAQEQTGFNRQAPWENGNEQVYALGPTDSTQLGDGTYFNGAIDEFHVFNHALTQAEVDALGAVPEPGSLALLGLGGLALLARRRRV